MAKSIRRNRHSIRKQGFDYSLAGAYFITLVTFQRMFLFGEIVNGEILLNPTGKIAFDQWRRLERRFPQSDFSTVTIMPNHIHGIISIIEGAGEDFQKPDRKIPPLRSYILPHVIPGSLGAIVRAYKSAVTLRINLLRDSTVPTIWQRNYYEHIIRDQKDQESIWEYIETNPQNWRDDQFNPDRDNPVNQ
jgi:putative transposase